MSLTTSSSAIIIPLQTQARASSWDPKWTPKARQALLKNGYEPTPLIGKRPVLDQWQNSHPTAEDITAWERTHPTATNTGILTRLAPAVDDDVLDPTVAHIVHQWVKELIPPNCPELLRYGRYPKRAIVFRCDKPFSKVSTGKWIDEKGVEQQLEILCDGQQLVVYGTHPDTNEAYIWPGARPGRTPRTSLPLLTPEAAQALVNRAKALFQERGWRPKREERKEPPKANGFSRSDSEAHKIALGLADRIEALCRELLPKGRIDGKNWAVGDINGAPGQSLKVCLVGENRGLLLDFADEGWRGDALDLIEATKNLKTVDAMDWARLWLGWPRREPPRKIQEPSHHPSASTQSTPDSIELVMRKGSEIKMEPVCWLWDQRIAIGKLCLIAGEPGLAKSQVTLWLASEVTTGDVLPSGSAAPHGRVVILSAEDAPEDTIIPRLKAVDADLDRISIISMVRETKDGVSAQRSFDLQLDLPALEKEIAKLADVKLIVIDPIASYMGKRVDSHKNAEVRAVLEPVATFAAKHKVTVLGVTHFSKGAGPTAINKFIGSIAFIAAARSAFVVTMDPESEDEDRRLFLPVKNNLAKLGHGLAFRVEQTLIDQDGTNMPASHIRWLDETIERNANAILAALAEEHSPAISQAEDFLREFLAGGRKRMTDVREAARGHGHAWRTIERAKRNLQVASINHPESPAKEGGRPSRVGSGSFPPSWRGPPR
jgi:AAA domain/Bifunctional DNA primase/polymerase, N-terminal